VSELPAGSEEHATVLGRPAVFWHRRGPGPTVVLLHGSGGNHRAFDELVAALDGEDVIVPALPGRSGTEGPPATTAAAAATFVRALLTAIGVERAVVMGHSYGGGVALELALADVLADATASPRVGALLLVATGGRLRVHPAILERARAAAAGEAPPLDQRAVFQPDTDPARVDRFEARTATVPAATTLADWTATNAFDRLGALAPLHVPLVALAGDRDVLTPPRYAQHFVDHVAGARAVTVPGGGHMLPVEQPEVVARPLRELGAAIRS
jgi:pimeloyl-ACP methyl ester carboxylesterase